jgi:hypothetical protein
MRFDNRTGESKFVRAEVVQRFAFAKYPLGYPLAGGAIFQMILFLNGNVEMYLLPFHLAEGCS